MKHPMLLAGLLLASSLLVSSCGGGGTTAAGPVAMPSTPSTPSPTPPRPAPQAPGAPVAPPASGGSNNPGNGSQPDDSGSGSEAPEEQPVPEQAPSPQPPLIIKDQDLFNAGELGFHTMRIPVLIRVGPNEFIAYTEGRRNSSSDSGDISILQKRLRYEQASGLFSVGPLEVIVEGNGNTRGNPTPVKVEIGPHAGRLLLLYNGNLGSDHSTDIMGGTSRDVRRAYLKFSDDNGLTYSPEQELTSARRSNWRTLAFGPAAGLQMQAGDKAGRIIVPGNYSDEGNIFRSYLLISDDGGETFQIGAVSAKDSSNEHAIVEFSPGQIYSSMRTGQDGYSNRNIPAIPRDGSRWIGRSFDAGLSFEQEYSEKAVRSPAVHGGATLIKNNSRGSPILILSAPTSKGRTGLTIYLSDDVSNFFSSYQITPGSSGYSNMQEMARDEVGIIYEYLDSQNRFNVKIVILNLSFLYGS